MAQVKQQPPLAGDAPTDLESAVQRKRRHPLDPRLDDISAAVRSGRLSLEDGMQQMMQVVGEVVGRVLRPEQRLALEHVMRDAMADYLPPKK